MKGKKGQAMVETALVLPILLLLIMGIIDFGLLFNHYILITNASREGARNASIGRTDTDIATTVMRTTTTLDASKLSVTIYPSEAMRKNGSEVTVTVEYDSYLITPVISAIIPNPVKLSAKTVMRME